MKTLLRTLFFLISVVTTAQEISYGPVLGVNIYSASNNNDKHPFRISDSKIFVSNLGAYLEYNFTENLGIKSEFTVNKKTLEYLPKSVYITVIPVTINVIDIAPSIKYDFGQEYRKGFYMTLGPKVAFLTKVVSEGEDVSSDFEKNTFGAQLGLGQRMFKFIDLQAKFDYEFTPFFKVENYKSKFIGVYVSLNVDIERLINNN